MFATDITLNQQAGTGVNLGKVAALQQGPTTTNGTTFSVRSVASQVNTTPLELDVQHQQIKRNGAKYWRSTVGLRLGGIAPPVANPEGVVDYGTECRIVLTRPSLTGVITDAAIAAHMAELVSFFGATLSTSGTPSAALQKFLNREV